MRAHKRREQTVLGGVAVLALAGILVKITGLVYKIPLTYLLGDEGMGYFNAAYTVYTWLYMLSTAGFPVAVSILIGEARGRADMTYQRGVLKTTAAFMLAIGTVGTLLMLLFADPLSQAVGNGAAAPAIRAVAPTLFFICIASLFRGYFQGYQNMVPTALSQVIESVGKVAFGLLFARWSLRAGNGLSLVASHAILGVSLGTFFGAVYLAVRYAIGNGRGEFAVEGAFPHPQKTPSVTRRLVGIALPVTLSASVMSLTTLIDLGMIISRLQDVGYTAGEATALYGNYTTLVVPLFHLPSTLITPLATGMIPALSKARAMQRGEDTRLLLNNAFRVASGIGVPCAFGMAFLAKPILALLYPAPSVESAYQLLSTISSAVFFLCVLTVTNATLQALGLEKYTLVSMGIGAVAKTVSGYLLLGNPNFGMLGAPIGTVVCYALAVLISISVLAVKTGYTVPFGILVGKPLVSSLLGIGISTLLYHEFFWQLGRFGGILLTVFLAVVLYAFMAYATGLFTREDLWYLTEKVRKPKKRRAHGGA